MFNRNGDNFSVSIPSDEDGYLGRQCPECESYFKIISGTGLKGTTHCICPYCGHKADHDQFWTYAQIEYAQSVVLNHVTKGFHDMFKRLERKHRPKRGSLFSIEIKTKGRPTQIQYYREARLETRIECNNCTLKYAVYGVYAFCPDCEQHNSHQILAKNLDLVQKLLDLAHEAEDEIAEILIHNALEDVVSTFDGFGREVCRVFADKSTNPSKAADIRFQNLSGAQTNLQKYFGFDLSSPLTTDEWGTAIRCFQKRHLLAHSSGVIDADYIKKANDLKAVEGRKVTITSAEVTKLIELIRKLGAYLIDEMNKLPQ